MDAIDREQTRKTPRAPKQSQVNDRSTVVISQVAPTSARLPAIRGSQPVAGDDLPMIVPGRPVAPGALEFPRVSGRPVLSRAMRFAAVIICIVAVLGTALAYNVAHSGTSGGANVAASVPQPSGRGPLTAAMGVIVAAPAPQSVHSTQQINGNQSQSATTSAGVTVSAKGLLSLEPCHDSVMFVPNISQWTVPPGCYGNIYVPNPANYVQAASWGYCNWWVSVTHPNTPDITYTARYPRGTTPVAGAAIYFDGGEQGADPAGHWAEAVAVSPDHYWVLISEMNFAWRGAGFGRIDYRYIHVSPYVHFIYGV